MGKDVLSKKIKQKNEFIQTYNSFLELLLERINQSMELQICMYLAEGINVLEFFQEERCREPLSYESNPEIVERQGIIDLDSKLTVEEFINIYDSYMDELFQCGSDGTDIRTMLFIKNFEYLEKVTRRFIAYCIQNDVFLDAIHQAFDSLGLIEDAFGMACKMDIPKLRDFAVEFSAQYILHEELFFPEEQRCYKEKMRICDFSKKYRDAMENFSRSGSNAFNPSILDRKILYDGLGEECEEMLFEKKLLSKKAKRKKQMRRRDSLWC